MINPNKTSTIRLVGEVNVEQLAKAVTDLPEAIWTHENAQKPNKFQELNEAQHIVFRFVNSTQDHTQFTDLPLWLAFKGLIQPLLDQATQSYGYQTGAYPRIMLARLPAGKKIVRHIDGAPAAQFPHKIHIPLQTNLQTTFHLDNLAEHFEVGKAYEVNNNVHHWSENQGQTDRIHLIFEYFPLPTA